ncbi:hypothetical protein EDD21DRAFT_415037 [Dissophora ornata]|nr:hypothetical protein EDD21DRAFT_415037 [Dissophora ornata]
MSELQSFIVNLCSLALRAAAQPRVDQELIDRIIALTDASEQPQTNDKGQRLSVYHRLINDVLSLSGERPQEQQPSPDSGDEGHLQEQPSISERSKGKRPVYNSSGEDFRGQSSTSQMHPVSDRSGKNSRGQQSTRVHPADSRSGESPQGQPSARMRPVSNKSVESSRIQSSVGEKRSIGSVLSWNSDDDDEDEEDNALQDSLGDIEPQAAVGSANDRTPSLQYRHESSVEFPNGVIEYSREISESEIGQESHSVGWAMVVYGHNASAGSGRRTYNKSCLGVHQCPKCNYVERPRLPLQKKNKYALPQPPKGVCKVDGSKLEHIPCKATLTVVYGDGMVYMIHNGLHNHAKPPVSKYSGKPAKRRALEPNPDDHQDQSS